jgi:peptide/nickel transport system ATP-binding protein
MGTPLIEIKGLSKRFPIHSGLSRRVTGEVRAIDGIDLTIMRGETLGLVGESGCGKSTTGRAILRAIEPSAGEILFHGEHGTVDVAKLGRTDLKRIRRKMQMVFQDPYASLNPRMNVEEIIAEPLICLEHMSGRARRERVTELLELVGLDSGYLLRYPHTFSGGQRQRIGIARALALEPDFVVCDEAVSALDVSVQAQVLNLLIDIQERLGTTYLFVSHDLGVIEHQCDRVAVMYLGKIVEFADTETLLRRPKMPYVEALLSAVPEADPHVKRERVAIRGEVADPANLPSGCPFHPRCPYAQDVCRTAAPTLRQVEGETGPHLAACHFAEALTLRGVGA